MLKAISDGGVGRPFQAVLSAALRPTEIVDRIGIPYETAIRSP